MAAPRERRSLDFLFAPRSVAVIGATERPGSLGRALLWNLISSPFGGTVYPVNPKRQSVLGVKAHPTVRDLPGPAELAVIATPAHTVPAVIEQCAAAEVRGAIIISAGFRESGPEGAVLEQRCLETAQASRMRLVGPNCLGIMRPVTGFNATFAPAMARPGNVAFLSQSGALCSAVLDWSRREQVGFSAFLSLGSMIDVDWGTLIDYFGNDHRTRSIVIYMESIGDARSFLSAAREVALQKPIIVMKAGRTEQAARAAASHTGSLTGSDEVLDAAFRRCGVLRVSSISDMFSMTEVLATQPRPHGPRLVIVTNAGGPGVVATDALLAAGGQLATLSPQTIAALNEFLPRHWSHNNPVDIIGDADATRYTRTIDALIRNPEGDGLVVIMAPQGVAKPTEIAEAMRPFAKLPGKAILASWMGAVESAEGQQILNSAGIPTFAFPDSAVQAFHYMWRYSYNLRGLYETPALAEEPEMAAGRGRAAALLGRASAAGEISLSESESKTILAAYGIPVAEASVASTEEEAVRLADEFARPVVLKVHSRTILHKSVVSGVRLDLRDAASVRAAFRSIQSSVESRGEEFSGVSVQPMISEAGYELILGSTVDPQFGPVLLFGSGGRLVDLLDDRAIALPPLNTTLARRFMEQTRIYHALSGCEGFPSADVPALERLLVRFSQLVVEQPLIREIDINPLLATANGLIALDARIILHADASSIARPAIRPYPTQYVSSATLRDGTQVMLRPIRPEDEPMMVAFHHTLSEQSVYMRYFQWMKLDQRIDHERLTRMCFVDYDRQIALVAEHCPASGPEILGVGRLVKSPRSNDAEVAIVISDHMHGRGLGTLLARRLIDVARAEKLDQINASVLYENHSMLRILERLGFLLETGADAETVEAVLSLA